MQSVWDLWTVTVILTSPVIVRELKAFVDPKIRVKRARKKPVRIQGFEGSERRVCDTDPMTRKIREKIYVS